jgi:hypothetical protein
VQAAQDGYALEADAMQERENFRADCRLFVTNIVITLIAIAIVMLRIR